jgi:tRNA(fMet)-specific endonuclease VapC
MAKNEVILCDTNIFINLFKGHEKARTALDKIGNENIALSIITYAEIIYGTKKADVNAIKTFFENYAIIDIDINISKTFKGIVLNYSYSHHIKIPDALIAATSISFGFPLYTENKKDFDFIPEIKFHKS